LRPLLIQRGQQLPPAQDERLAMRLLPLGRRLPQALVQFWDVLFDESPPPLFLLPHAKRVCTAIKQTCGVAGVDL